MLAFLMASNVLGWDLIQILELAQVKVRLFGPTVFFGKVCIELESPKPCLSFYLPQIGGGEISAKSTLVSS